MRGFARWLLAAAALMMLGALPAAAAPKAARMAPPVRVLVFSKTTGYRHASIEAGVAALKAMARRENLRVEATEDPDVFSGPRLSGYDVIVLLSDTTNPKDPASEWFVGDRREALQAFVHRGGGIVGVHAAADSHYFWPWYGRMMGGHFARHPQGTPTGQVTVVDSTHPSTTGLPKTVTRTDEWYYFDDYDPTQQLLVTLDPTTIGQPDVNPNPMSWAKTFEGGRVFYTAMGHTPESFSEPFFLQHLAGGVRWAAGGKPKPARPRAVTRR